MSLRQLVIRLFLAATGAVFLLWGAFCLWFMYGQNYQHVMSPIEIPDESWWMVSGEGHSSDRGFVMTRPGYRAQAIVAASLPVAISADGLESITVRFARLGSFQSLSLGIGQSDSPARAEAAPVEWTDEQVAQVSIKRLRLHAGEARHVVVRAMGGLEPGLEIESAVLRQARPTFFELQGLLLRSLVNTGAWTQRSINHNRPDYRPLRVSPVVVAALWAALMFGLLMLWPELRRAGRPLAAAGAAFLLAWLVLDLGWQVTLWQRHAAAVDQYGGLPPGEKRRTEVDGDVFEFIEELKDELDDSRRRMVIFGDSEFAHYQARYFAVPQPVNSRKRIKKSWLRRLRHSDVLTLIHLSDAMEERPVRVQAVQQSERRSLDLEAIAGRHAGYAPCSELAAGQPCDAGFLRLREDERPWLVELPYGRQFAPGLWRMQLDLIGGGQGGWARLEVYRRAEGEPAARWAWREVYVPSDRAASIDVAFRVDEAGQYLVRLRPLDARGVRVVSAGLQPVKAGDGLVELSLDGSPPFFLARRLLEREGHAALEML